MKNVADVIPTILKALTGAASLPVGTEAARAVADVLVWLLSSVSAVAVPENVYNAFVLLIGMAIAGVAVYFVPNLTQAAASGDTN